MIDYKFEKWWESHPAERIAFQTKGDAMKLWDAAVASVTCEYCPIKEEVAICKNQCRFDAAVASLAGLRGKYGTDTSPAILARAVRDADDLMEALSKKPEPTATTKPNIHVHNVRQQVKDLIQVSLNGRERDEIWRTMGSPQGEMGTKIDEAIELLRGEGWIKLVGNRWVYVPVAKS